MFEISSGRPSRLAALIVVGALAVAACTSGATPTPPATPTAAEATPTRAAATPTEEAGAYDVNVGTGAVGDYLTGAGGLTLYVKQGDSTTATNCTGSCITAWPPFTVQAGGQVVAGAGVTGTLGTWVRPEGKTQVTYNGQPLYYFSGDAAPGDTNGQGIAGVWSVAAP